MYDDINDYELLDMVCDNEIATESLFEKYKPLIISIASKAYRKNSINGLELNDLIQEGMIGLSVAINTFNDKKDATFYTFARLCIIRRVTSYLIANNRQKYLLLNESISVEKIVDNNNSSDDLFVDNKNNPEELLISGENVKEIMKRIEKELTGLECEVFELKTVGFSNREISEILEKDIKSISNALERVKNKLKKFQ